MKFGKETDRGHRVIIEPQIRRAFWSKRRAWPGDEVKLHIETRWVPDGTKVAVEFWEDDSGEGSPDDFMARLEEEHTIENNRCVIDYKIEWDYATLGQELELEGSDYEFYFLASVDKFSLQQKSTLLYVDLDAFSPSF